MFGFGGSSKTEGTEGDKEGKPTSKWSIGGITSTLASLPGKVKETVIQKKNEFQAEHARYSLPDGDPPAPTVTTGTGEEEGKGGKDVTETLPFWKGCLPEGDHRESELQMEILSLSGSKAPFLSPPVPPIPDFAFDHASGIAECERALHHDPRLAETRYILVPRKVKEPRFWLNYFHNVAALQLKYKSMVEGSLTPGSPAGTTTTTTTKATPPHLTTTSAATPVGSTASPTATTPGSLIADNANKNHNDINTVVDDDNDDDDDDGDDSDDDVDVDEFIENEGAQAAGVSLKDNEPWLANLKDELGIGEDKNLLVDEYETTDPVDPADLALLEEDPTLSDRIADALAEGNVTS